MSLACGSPRSASCQEHLGSPIYAMPTLILYIPALPGATKVRNLLLFIKSVKFLGNSGILEACSEVLSIQGVPLQSGSFLPGGLIIVLTLNILQLKPGGSCPFAVKEAPESRPFLTNSTTAFHTIHLSFPLPFTHLRSSDYTLKRDERSKARSKNLEAALLRDCRKASAS